MYCIYAPRKFHQCSKSMEAEVRRLAGNRKELKSLALEMSEWMRRDLVDRITALTIRCTINQNKASRADSARNSGRLTGGYTVKQKKARKGRSISPGGRMRGRACLPWMLNLCFWQSLLYKPDRNLIYYHKNNKALIG